MQPNDEALRFAFHHADLIQKHQASRRDVLQECNAGRVENLRPLFCAPVLAGADLMIRRKAELLTAAVDVYRRVPRLRIGRQLFRPEAIDRLFAAGEDALDRRAFSAACAAADHYIHVKSTPAVFPAHQKQIAPCPAASADNTDKPRYPSVSAARKAVPA